MELEFRGSECNGIVKYLPDGKHEIVWENKQDNDEELVSMMTNEASTCTTVQVQQHGNQVKEISPAKDLITAVTAGLIYLSPEVNVSHYSQESIYYSNPAEKSLCRIIQVILSLSNKATNSFTSADLFSLIDHIDMLTSRNHLYDKQLQDICNFLIPQDIPVTYPWEKLLDPVKRLAANPICRVGLVPIAIRIYLLLVLQSKLGDLSGINLPSLLTEVDCSHPINIESIVANHIGIYNNNLINN